MTAHVASAASVPLHADVSTEYCPVVTKVGTGNGPAAKLVKVSVCEALAVTSRLPKLSDVAESEKPGVPVPFNSAVCELPDEATVSVPV